MENERRRGLMSIGGINVDPVLANNDWETIAAVAQAGKGADFWSVGDTKYITLRASSNPNLPNLANYGCYVKIIGINHNESKEGKGIHFQFCFPYLISANSWNDLAFADSAYGKAGTTTGFRMNTSSTNAGGWKDSFMRNTICSIFYNQCLPDDLKAVIQPCTKYTLNSSSTVSATTDKLWLLAEYEVFGKNINSSMAESGINLKQYDYYKNLIASGKKASKYKHSNANTEIAWWLRSPKSGSSTNFCYIMAAPMSGSISNSKADNSYGFAPCFKL